MLKKDILGFASAQSLTETFRCGECLHFKTHAHSTRQRPCAEEGVKAVGIAPKCFTADISRLVGNSDQFVQLASLFQSYTPLQKRTLLALLRSKQRGHKLGTKLYFRVGKDFISNYLAGFVAGYSSSGELMLIGSPDRKTRGASFFTYMTNDSQGLLTISEWRTKRTELAITNQIFDPTNKIVKKSSVVDDYEPPTIDTVPTYVYNKAEPPTAKKRRKETEEISFNVA